MAKLSKSDAAKAAGVSRQTLYTYLKDGRISVDEDGLIDTAELLRAGFALHEVGRQIAVSGGHDLTSTPEPVDVYRDMIALLQQQLDAACAREQRREEELAWLRHQFEQMQQRYDRLLEAPHPAPTAPPAPPVAPVPPTPRQRVWQRLRAVLGGRRA